jgi:hypothetical protein
VTDSELIEQAQAVARRLTYNEEPQGAAKQTIHELSHRLGGRVVRIDKRGGRYRMVTLFGSERSLTWAESWAYRLFRLVPRGFRLDGAGAVPKPRPWPPAPERPEQGGGT